MPKKIESLTAALKDYFAPVNTTELIAFSKSLTDDEKNEFRNWFRANGYPDVA
jgi:hypothetical protein